MKLQSYIINNLTNKKGRTILMVLGIIFACSGMIVINLMTEKYSRISTAFFTPFNDYDQIVERGTDYIQLLPISSSIDQNKQIEIEEKLEVESIPSLLISNIIEITSFKTMGLNLEDMPILLNKMQLNSGFWPNNSKQIIVGDYWGKYGNLTLYNETFQIVGSIAPSYTFLDQMIYMDLNELQILTGLSNQVSVIFIPNEIEEQNNLIEEFELEFPQLDLLTVKEMDNIKGGLSSYINNISIVLSSFSTISALIFIFSIETINIYSKKKDFDIMVILGTPKKKILGLLINESIFLSTIGLILGLPFSILSFSLIWSKMLQSVGRSSFNLIFVREFRILINTLPLKMLLSTSLFIILFGLAFTIIPALLALKKYNLGDIKQKF
ncbi:ABC transporter permease [Promethearchaeum syntrophicum]|uniref:ABC transporter permease n=1 Tax=Promethearchaeum syntrophicum TaxID=2594042 RepID=A0A5B9D5V8_9ARCH|nr:FtsX-like permease family protein [Candidatus Prometheoarchaeum syntrophicum]